VRLVFDSLTGMQDLWGSEDDIIRFYSRSCPRLYALETIAYWVIEKKAHSERLRARINHIAQVVIDLSLSRGKSALTIRKADKRKPATLNQPVTYWSEGHGIDALLRFEKEKGQPDMIDLGSRLKAIRRGQGMSQKELARQVGVTPSTISQIESNQIYPSLPALFKIAATLIGGDGVPVSPGCSESCGRFHR
jgi:DNA-binding XRE family transcriptional regulator